MFWHTVCCTWRWGILCRSGKARTVGILPVIAWLPSYWRNYRSEARRWSCPGRFPEMSGMRNSFINGSKSMTRQSIGIDHPRMEAPFTEEQYRRAGITFEGIDLPEESDKETTFVAKIAARKAGYDDFGESHTPLAIVVHEGIKAKIIRHFYLSNTGLDICDKEYKSKFTAQQAARTQINKAYNEAGALFDPSGSKCIVSEFAEAYANRIHSGMDQLLERLAPRCTAKRQKELLLQLAELTEKAEKSLKELFFTELRESADYYKLYQRQYFCNRVAVEQEGPDVFVSDFMNGVARVFASIYTVSASDFCECMAELQEDVDSRVNAFADAVHQSYKEYCEKIEEIAEELGKDFSKEDLERFGLIEA